MRRAGVNYAHGRIIDGSHRFTRGVVGQTQDGNVAAIDRFGATTQIFALCCRQGQRLQIAAPTQVFVYVQTCGALVTVDENNRSGHDQIPS
jgi:hypothetical protein